MPTIETGSRMGSAWSLRVTATQPRPHTKPLPYILLAGTARKGVADYPFTVDIRNDIPNANGFDHQPSIDTASNRALAKLYDEMGQAADLLVAWKERQSALDLVASNVKRLVDIARAVKRRDPSIVRSVMGRKPRGSDVPRTPAKLWLEYHFAIVPLVSDIHHALGIFDKTFGSEPFRFVGEGQGTVTYRANKYSLRQSDYQARVILGGRISAIDPNLSLASRFGFGQPLSVAWEMTPFSWFVDYFGNVSQMIANIEPRFPGITIDGPYTSTVQSSATSHWSVDRYFTTAQGKPLPEGRLVCFKAYSGTGYSFRRTKGHPLFQMEFKSPLSLKGQQCSYIVAVLTGIFANQFDKFSRR